MSKVTRALPAPQPGRRRRPRRAGRFGSRISKTRVTPLSARGFQIGLAGVVALILLRVGIGWHFLYQGVTKIIDPDFSSRGFISQAKGPLASRYLALIPDYWGRERLDTERVLAEWQAARSRAQDHFGYGEAQQRQADKLFALRKFQLTTYVDDNREAIDEYLAGLDRWQQAEQDPRYNRVAFQQQRIVDEKKKLRSQAQEWLAEVDRLSEAWEQDLDRLATAEQRSRGPVPHPPTKLEEIDRLTMYSNMAVGVCLIAGFCTRFAALGGAAFLFTLILSQWPWPTVYPPDPPSAGKSFLVNKEVVEMLGLVAIAATPVGRWGGLDFFIGPLWRRLRGKRSES